MKREYKTPSFELNKFDFATIMVDGTAALTGSNHDPQSSGSDSGNDPFENVG